MTILSVNSTHSSWDPNTKEKWFLEFEKEPVNDERWSCSVATAVPNEAQDEEFIELYAEFVATGTRKAVKTISVTDVVKLLKECNAKQESKKSKMEKRTRKAHRFTSNRFSQVLNLATKHAVLNDYECNLQPELMAAVIKYMILNMKEEHRHQKRVDIVRERKTRERNIKAKFIGEMKPFEVSQEVIPDGQTLSIHEQKEMIKDEPIDGPDLYILLINFYDLMCYTELQKINVPFCAIFKIVNALDYESGKPSEIEVEAVGRRQTLISNFWENLKEHCDALEKTDNFKDFAIMEYKTPVNITETEEYCRSLFNEITWMQYSANHIYKQHQKYLQELHVQRLILSLEPLDLSKCTVYNKLCIAAIAGEPLTPLLILYAMVEQVVAGVPETESEVMEYQPRVEIPETREVDTGDSQRLLVTPCLECRDKTRGNICHEGKNLSQEDQSQVSEEEECRAEATEATEPSEECNSENATTPESLREEYSDKSRGDTNETVSHRLEISESLLNRIANERQKSKESQENKKWKMPKLCFYGDSLHLQTYYFDPRILDTSTIYDRFLKNSDMSKIWKKYPELPPGERAFFNFHFFNLWKISKEPKEKIRLKILFILSMKLAEMTKSYMYRGDSDALSEMIGKPNKFSRVKFNESVVIQVKEHQFSKYFLKNFIMDFMQKKTTLHTPKEKHIESLIKTFSGPIRNGTSASDQRLARRAASCSLNKLRSFEGQLPQYLKTSEKDLMTFYSLLDCFEISSIIEMHSLSDRNECLNFIRNYKFYENLSPNLMMQRMVQASDEYNAIQCSYFPPTDTLIITMYNERDHRGIFYNHSSAVLLTPVTLRDFYNHVYPTIGDWLLDDYEERMKFTEELKEKYKAKEEKKDADYLKQLKREFCSLSEEQRREYLEADIDDSEPEVKEKELGELPIRPRVQNTEKVSFIATNYNDLRVENTKDINEFYSEDGTKVNVTIDSWLYSQTKMLKLMVKRSGLSLYHYQIVGQNDVNTSFSCITNSDMIFRFNKDTASENFKYNLTISWPVGLLIQPIHLGSTFYIRQHYLEPHPEVWEIEQESSRCFLKNGSLIIFKKNGDYEILHGSGTKYVFYQEMGKHEIISTTGEVWVIPSKGPCRNRKKLLTQNKILVGVDPTTQETFYKREDGTYCMLWKSGKLVTNYPDGTKMTSTPDFAEEEVTTEWTEEEKAYFEELDTKRKSEVSVQEPRSRTILRNSSSTPKTTSRKSFSITGFVLITCSYLMEHPKYATVCLDSHVRITMPEQMSVTVNPNGSYEVQKGRNFLTVSSSRVEFYTLCQDCSEKSTAFLYLNTNEVLCKVIDFFKNALFVYRNGKTKFLESYQTSYGEAEVDILKQSVGGDVCNAGHEANQALNQRCFAFERDLSGIEFIHSDTLAQYFQQLPENTYFEFNTDDPLNITHTFESSYYKVGYEKWEMCYEKNDDSLPTNLKKKDMKELGTKQVRKNPFKYPFPKFHNCTNTQQNEDQTRNVEMPKIIVSRTVKCLSREPDWVLKELHKYIAEYQRRAQDIFREYKNHSGVGDRSQDYRYVMMRLTKIALTQSQSLKMYPHLCENLPSTEKDVHYFGHFINLMEEIKGQVRENSDFMSDCKQAPNRLPRSSEFAPIIEEFESRQNC